MALFTSKFVLIPAAILVILVVVLIVVLTGGDDDKEAVPITGTIPAKDLVVGSCISDANTTTGDVTTFDAIACDKPHDGEVYTIIELEGKLYPGLKAVTGKGQRGCRARLRRQLTAKAYRDRLLGYKYVYPTKQSWVQGDREVTCLATFRKPRAKKLEQRAAAAKS